VMVNGLWTPQKPRMRPFRVVLDWLVASAALLIAAEIVPRATVHDYGGAVVPLALVALLNAPLPPLIAALRLPLMLVVGFLLVLVLDALMLLAVDSITDRGVHFSSFWAALLVALIASGVGVALAVLVGTNDDDVYTFRVTQRIARRSGQRIETDAPGIIFLE